MQSKDTIKDKRYPDPLLRLIGPANEATIIVEGQRFLALIDSGAQLSTMSESLVQALKLPVHKLNTLIEAEASGGGIIPCVGYVEARLVIPGIKKIDKDPLFMVSNNSPYTNKSSNSNWDFTYQRGITVSNQRRKRGSSTSMGNCELATTNSSKIRYIERT